MLALYRPMHAGARKTRSPESRGTELRRRYRPAFGRPIEVVTDMSKSRKLGFLDYQATEDSFFDLFARLRRERIIP